MNLHDREKEHGQTETRKKKRWNTHKKKNKAQHQTHKTQRNGRKLTTDKKNLSHSFRGIISVDVDFLLA